MTASRRMEPRAGSAMARMEASCGELLSPDSALDTRRGSACSLELETRASTPSCRGFLPDVLLGSQVACWEGGEGTERSCDRGATLKEHAGRLRC